jgi:hypothetical protein
VADKPNEQDVVLLSFSADDVLIPTVSTAVPSSVIDAAVPRTDNSFRMLDSGVLKAPFRWAKEG